MFSFSRQSGHVNSTSTIIMINKHTMLNSSNNIGTYPHSQTAQFLSNFNTPPSLYSQAASANEASQEAQQFAPNFLFGNQQPTNRRNFATPTRHTLQVHGSPGILKSRELNTGGNKSVHWSPVLVRKRSKSPEGRMTQRIRQETDGKKVASTLWNGPPLRSLNEDIIGTPEKQSRLEIPTEQLVVSTSQLTQAVTQESDMVELDLLNGEEDEDDIYCITVFGFLPEQRDEILELFSRHGDIMAEKSANSNSNWMHIRYSSPVHVRQALAKNATFFRGQMIGVIPCKDKEALEDETAAHNTTPIISGSTTNKSRLNESMLLLERDDSLLLNGSRLVPSTSAYKTGSSPLPSRARLSISSRAGMRPLNSSLIAMNGDHSMDSSFQQQKSGGADDSFFGKLWNIFTTVGGNDL